MTTSLACAGSERGDRKCAKDEEKGCTSGMILIRSVTLYMCGTSSRFEPRVGERVAPSKQASAHCWRARGVEVRLSELLRPEAGGLVSRSRRKLSIFALTYMCIEPAEDSISD